MSLDAAVKRLSKARRSMKALDEDEWAGDFARKSARKELERAQSLLLRDLERARKWALEPYNAKPWPESVLP
jgi:hypothetical protein